MTNRRGNMVDADRSNKRPGRKDLVRVQQRLTCIVLDNICGEELSEEGNTVNLALRPRTLKSQGSSAAQSEKNAVPDSFLDIVQAGHKKRQPGLRAASSVASFLAGRLAEADEMSHPLGRAGDADGRQRKTLNTVRAEDDKTHAEKQKGAERLDVHKADTYAKIAVRSTKVVHRVGNKKREKGSCSAHSESDNYGTDSVCINHPGYLADEPRGCLFCSESGYFSYTPRTNTALGTGPVFLMWPTPNTPGWDHPPLPGIPPLYFCASCPCFTLKYGEAPSAEVVA
ncbi:hypothetical protein EDB85DRAFT_1884656 [Lactarius pseudohatsudake]|nr:hypothetical protein EDB85DRAFT_1884656 [Lactarius pseudohatsudake]